MKKKILISLSYLLVAMLATVATLAAIGYPGYASGTKLEQLESLILDCLLYTSPSPRDCS